MTQKSIPLFISIRSKIYAVIGTVTLFAIILALVSWALFQTFSKTLYIITRESSPISAAASNLDVLSRDINLDMNKTLASHNKDELAQNLTRIMKHIAQMQSSVQYINSLSNSELETKRINKELSSINKVIIEINKSVSKNISYKEKISDFSMKIRSLQKQFIISITPISDNVFYELPTLSYALHLKSEGNSLFNILNLTENLRELEKITPLKEKFKANKKRAENKIKTLIENHKNNDVPLKNLSSTVMALFDIGLGKNNIFDIKESQLSNERILRQLKEKIEASTNNISTDLLALQEAVKKQILSIQDTAEKELTLGKTVIFAIAFVSIIISFFLGWWIIGRNITQRLEDLKTNMLEVFSGKLDTIVPHTGMDEVAEMSKALIVFKDKMVTLKNSQSRENFLMTILYQGSSAANNAESFEDAALSCLRLISTYACWPSAHMYVLNPKTRSLESSTIWTGGDDNLKKGLSKMTFRLGEELPGRVMSINKPDYIKNMDNSEMLLRGDLLKKAGIKSVYAYPIRTGSRFFGVVEFFSKNEFKLDKGLTETIENIFNQLGVAIQRIKTEEDLRLEKEKAEAATYAKGNFLANMSHEIRTPLNAVLGMVDLILESELKAEQRYWAKTIKTSGDSLLDIINDILDFSKIEAHELLLESINFNLHKVIEEIFELIRVRALAQGIEIYAIIEPNVPAGLVGDPGRIRQVIINLIGNAIKFTKSGHVALRVSVIQDLTHSTQIKIEIEDTGIGIKEDKINYIFSTFSQAEESTSRKFGGTGLGLSICEKLVELMGGNIGVKSQFGEGSTFFFLLALKKHDEIEQKCLEKYKEITLKGQTALILEKEGLGTEAIQKYLNHLDVSSTFITSEAAFFDHITEKSKADFSYDYLFINSKLIDNNPIAFGNRLKDIKGTEKSFKIHLVNTLYMIAENEISPYLDAQLTKPLLPNMLESCLKILSQSRKDKNYIKRALNPALIDSLIQGTDGPVVDQSKRFEGLHILIVEDMKANMVLLSTILKKMGITISTAVNGKEAVKQFEENDFNLIFMDCQMPEMDGFDATRNIRKILSKPQCPIVALTANAMQGDKDKCLAAGMDDYLNKPLRKEKLIKAIERWAVKESQNGRKGHDPKKT